MVHQIKKAQKQIGGFRMNTLIVIHSYHHNNTQKIGETIAGVLDAKVQAVLETDFIEIQNYDLIGFGAGIDSGKHYKPMLEFAKALPIVQDKGVFIFSTSGVAGKKRKMANDHSVLREILLSKGYKIVDEFQCKGHNTNSILKHFGGMNKGRPNVDDLETARHFAKMLGQRYSISWFFKKSFWYIIHSYGKNMHLFDTNVLFFPQILPPFYLKREKWYKFTLLPRIFHAKTKQEKQLFATMIGLDIISLFEMNFPTNDYCSNSK